MVMLVYEIALIKPIIKAASVKLNKSKLSLTVGKTYKLKVKNNKKKVKWTSSNKKVATVSSKGKVCAKGKGKAVITAKVKNKKYKCYVIVKNSNQNPTQTYEPSPIISYASPYQKSNIGDIYDGNKFFKMMGKKYYYGFCGEPCYNSWAQYNLGEKYNTMSFSLGHVDNTAFEDATFVLEFDGVVVEQINLTGDMTTINKSISVKGVKNMKVSFRDAAHVTSWYGIANIVFDDSISLLRADSSTSNIEKNGVTYAIPYQKGDVGEIYSGNKYFEMMGEKYYYGFCGEPCYNSVAQFNLEGKYKEMSYKIGHVDNTAYENATLLIELDGRMVDNIELTGDMQTISKTIDVSGGVNLKVQIRDAGHTLSWYAIADIILK